jgi:hypothetical protein
MYENTSVDPAAMQTETPMQDDDSATSMPATVSPEDSGEFASEGDMTQGDTSQGDMTGGDMSQGEMTGGDMTDGSMTDGSMSDGTMVDDGMGDAVSADGTMPDESMPEDGTGTSVATPDQSQEFAGTAAEQDAVPTDDMTSAGTDNTAPVETDVSETTNATTTDTGVDTAGIANENAEAANTQFATADFLRLLGLYAPGQFSGVSETDATAVTQTPAQTSSGSSGQTSSSPRTTVSQAAPTQSSATTQRSTGTQSSGQTRSSSPVRSSSGTSSSGRSQSSGTRSSGSSGQTTRSSSSGGRSSTRSQSASPRSSSGTSTQRSSRSSQSSGSNRSTQSTRSSRGPLAKADVTNAMSKAIKTFASIGKSEKALNFLSNALVGKPYKKLSQKEAAIVKKLASKLAEKGFNPKVILENHKDPKVLAYYNAGKDTVAFNNTNLTKKNLQATANEELGEAIGAMAKKMGMKVGSGDIGARFVKLLQGKKLVGDDFVAKESDKVKS